MTTHHLWGTRLYRIWHDMISRCKYPKHNAYSRYGGKGIRVCLQWQNFIPFMNWALSNGYKDNLTIDRINRDKGYSPENCRWSTRSEQELNKKKTGKEGVLFIFGKWRSVVKRNGATKHLGMFNTQEEAINARKEFIEKEYGKCTTI
jgi:hypothetical protein